MCCADEAVAVAFSTVSIAYSAAVATSVSSPAISTPETIPAISTPETIPAITAAEALAEAVPAPVKAPIPVKAASPVAVIPGAGTDEEAAKKPARSIKSVRCASVRIIGIISPAADWSRPIVVVVISRIDSNTDANRNLRMCVRDRNKHGNQQKHEITYIPHV
jgi:hypothetical protein